VSSFASGLVRAILSERQGLQRVDVDGRRAYVLTQLIGPVAVGDRVVINTTAVDMGLGTGGWDVVHWNLSRSEWAAPVAGRGMKLRYTSLQVDVAPTEEAPSWAPGVLDAVPVVACGLHSQVACVAASFASASIRRRLVLVMSDWAALPLAISDLVADLRASGLLAATVTYGNAFGGDHEAVSLHSALEVATGSERADAVVVGPGPGIAGTGTKHGFTGLEVAAVANAAGYLGATPVLAIRYSDVDSRPRHRGISHHTTTSLAAVARPITLAVPAGHPAPAPGIHAHHVMEVTVPDMGDLLGRYGLTVTTMGRNFQADPGFFRYAGAAGIAAAELVDDPGPSRPPRR